MQYADIECNIFVWMTNTNTLISEVIRHCLIDFYRVLSMSCYVFREIISSILRSNC